MASDLPIEADAFASSLEAIFGDVRRACTGALDEGVAEGAKVSAKEWRKGIRANFATHSRVRPYSKSIRTKFRRGGDSPVAVVYSTKPGLPHLLEKGHATIGGGRVPGREHVAPAAEEGFRAAFAKVEGEVDLRL